MRGRSAAQAAFPMPLSSPQNPETGPNPSRTLTWLRLFKPARVRINQRERWRMVLGMVLCALRLAVGPTAQDRVLALDTLWMCTMLLALLLGIAHGSLVYFEAALLIALLGFVSTIALAKFLMRGEVIE